MNVIEEKTWFGAWLDVFKRGLDFKGTSTRAEYWHPTLLNILFSIGLSFVMVILAVSSPDSFLFVYFAFLLFTLVYMIPSLALQVRRLHDVGKSAWYLLLSFIPFVGPFILLYFYIQPSNPNTSYPRARG
ncbi:MAG: DUF805 domain-containing protein [Erysipelotrichaceae bacterium]